MPTQCIGKAIHFANVLHPLCSQEFAEDGKFDGGCLILGISYCSDSRATLTRVRRKQGARLLLLLLATDLHNNASWMH